MPDTGLAACGPGLMAGFALRVIGAALLLSKVREPRLPNDDFPPARASARLGASASVNTKNSDSRIRQLGRCAIAAGRGDRLVMSGPFASRKKAPRICDRRVLGEREIEAIFDRAVDCTTSGLISRSVFLIEIAARPDIGPISRAPGAALRTRQRIARSNEEDPMSRVSLFNSPLLLGFEHFERALDRVN